MTERDKVCERKKEREFNLKQRKRECRRGVKLPPKNSERGSRSHCGDSTAVS